MAALTRRSLRPALLALAAALVTTAPALAASPGKATAKQAAEPTPDVVEVRGGDAESRVNAALEALGGIGAFVHKGDTVVLKPNISFMSPREWGATTNPDVVVAVAKACLAAKAKKVIVVEFLLNDTEKCLERSGLKAALAKMPEVELQLLSPESAWETVAVPNGGAVKSLDVAKVVRTADVLISIPVAKHHRGATVSFGLKNSMGLIRDRKAFHNEYELHQAIADLGLAVRPKLTLLDATRSLLTNGPQGPGESVTLDTLVAGRAAASVDAYGLTLAKFGGKQLAVADVKHIELAGKAGLGETDVAKLKVKKIALGGTQAAAQ